ncbi:unnamed protein product [Calypogeia fissa]
MSITVSLQGGERWDANGEKLVPGIPNDITLEHITPKLPWTEFYNLSCVVMDGFGQFEVVMSTKQGGPLVPRTRLLSWSSIARMSPAQLLFIQ